MMIRGEGGAAEGLKRALSLVQTAWSAFKTA